MSKLKVTTISDPDNNNTALTVASDGKVTLAQDTTFNGNVGIGTSSPSRALHINTSQDYVAKFSSSDAGAAILLEDSNSTANYNRIGVITHDMQFVTNNTEAMRIDSSGNLLVGKTATNIASDGFQAFADGYVHMTADISSGSQVLSINRKTSDGNLVLFRKDGTTVGSIGSDSTNGGIYIDGGSSATGLRFADGGQIVPRRANADSDTNTDLGTSTNRFRNILLSGGAYIGGTGSANYLDDYEEGTWTPTGNTVTFSGAGGNYTKIGDIVVATFSVSMPSTSSGSHMTISGLPFAEVNTNLQGQSITYGGSLGYCQFTKASESRMAITTTTIVFYDSGTSILTEGDCSGADVRGTITYKTSS